ncbi:hypothetical protein [Aeromicrobium fastidiosum]|uniref:Tetratricopeptide repeat protein n=1 Tax=Aeromicrobium fastidiosum TaxID=52699 RepID=A0A641ALB1_9ACTN|nr:hypothetical protein [Aeromicrobium fastidiosum]KAA1376038.1 hypothetical protein ESP62_011315 [Aeromicrobium fastidiosum]MBP2392092.1 hypothetical protein [Aeromicrobium fastidiosum]
MELEDFADEIEVICMTGTPSERVEVLRRRLDDFTPGEIGRAEFLTALAGELNLVEDHDGARQASLAAIEDGGPTELDPRCGLLMNDLDAGEHERADEVLKDLLGRARTGALGSVECEWIAGSLEKAGRLRQALRWFTLPLLDVHPADVEDVDLPALHGRYRVRRELGLPLDMYDHARDEWLALEKELEENPDL